jgi:hypothetical protein
VGETAVLVIVSPKSHAYVSISSIGVDRLVKVTVSGAEPKSGEAVKLATSTLYRWA